MIEGVYVHIPFCSLKCPYCDFTSFVSFDEELYRVYVEAILKELSLYTDGEFDVKSVYFGGGTPSLLPPQLLEQIVDFITKNFKIDSKLEITVEANPNSCSPEGFRALKSFGVNRVSLGNQSFLEKNLKVLGRDHKPQDTVKSVYAAFESGIDNINLDLIYGIPGQSLSDLEKDLEIYTTLPITHISAYMLTPYGSTPFGVMVERGELNLPEEEDSFQMFLLIDQYLESRGFRRYELSNWGKIGFECKHNIFYWKHVEFLGVGVSAWSFIDSVRFGNTKNINQYITFTTQGKKPVVFREYIDEEKLKEEKIFLGLRLREGISLELVKDREFLQRLVSEGYGQVSEGRFSLTPKGIMVLNHIASRFV